VDQGGKVVAQGKNDMNNLNNMNNMTRFTTVNISAEEFHSKKITNKVVQQVGEALVLASSATPDWCDALTTWCPMLFPFETRQLYFTCTAFGASRAIVWLQNKRDATLEHARGPTPRREDSHEYRVGRLKHERVTIPRQDDTMLDWARQVMRCHAARKSVLEIEFLNEEGTGLGPTLEFYALVAAELQARHLGLWLADDDFPDDQSRDVDLGQGHKVAGYYVQRSCGLFPAPRPQDAEDIQEVCSLFWFCGVMFAKCLQDGRLIDLPLSRPFLKLLCAGDVVDNVASHYRDLLSSPSITGIQDHDRTPTEEEAPQTTAEQSWYADLLTTSDFELIDPHRSRFLRQLRSLVSSKQRVMHDTTLTPEQCAESLAALTLENPPVRLEDLCLNFTFNPSSSMYGYKSYELKAGGEEEEVNLNNVEEYIELVTDFCLTKGIQRQMDSFKAGFDHVFPLEKLFPFSPDELRLMLCGDQVPLWNRDDVMQYTEPKLGYTKESPGFIKFVNVLSEMSGDERKAFLQFTTGCSSLPPGGLANLQPRLTVVRKVDGTDGSFPSVNTCVHYLKLPEYSSEEILRSRLIAATSEKGFHLN